MLALMLFLSNGICVFAKEDNIMARKAWIKKIDKVLENANVPESVIREMDDEFKEFIYENSGANIEYVKVKKVTGGKENLLRSGGYEISESDLELKVVAFKVGNKQVDIYPSYEWKKPLNQEERIILDIARIQISAQFRSKEATKHGIDCRKVMLGNHKVV